MNSDLWAKLEKFEIDQPGVENPFSKRLAQENNWSKEFALLAIQEYLKFIYLCAVSKSSMTPSKIVDKVWHLHLCYTHSYWNDLCRNILGKDIHHKPGTGSEEESRRFKTAYLSTLNEYKNHFGFSAPERFWPALKEQSISPRSRKRSTLNHLLFFKQLPWKIITSLSLVFLFVTGCSKFFSSNSEGQEAESDFFNFNNILSVLAAIVIIYWIIKFIIYLINNVSFKSGGGSGGDGCGSSCDSGGGDGGCGGGCGGD